MINVTHSELVEFAALYLRRSCNIVITEMASGAVEEPDAIGFNSSNSILVECKASRSDFLSDKRKPYRHGESGMGTQRYYCCPRGLIKRDELPERWGLLEVADGTIRAKVKVKRDWTFKKDSLGEICLLTSVIRRIGKDVKQIEGISARVYQYTTKNKATIAIAVEQTRLEL